MTARKDALAAGAMFYTGNVCKRHPELAGRRRAKSGGCPACIRERMAKHHKTKQYRQKQDERRRAVQAGERVPRKYRSAKKEATDVERAGG